LQLEKKSNDLQSDLISRCQSSEVGRPGVSNIKNQIKEVADEDLRAVSLNATNHTKPPYTSGICGKRGEEVSRG